MAADRYHDVMDFLVFIVCFVGATFLLSWVPILLETRVKRRDHE